MSRNSKKIELNVYEAASVYAYGSSLAIPERVSDEDEFFILVVHSHVSPHISL